jgi:hypothetical protein
MVAAFLADHAVGQSDGQFDADEFESWLDGFRPN